MNLLRNVKEAISGVGAPGKITIRVSTTNRPGFVEVTVADTGPGVPKDLQNLLFQPLKSSKAEGLGLGLSLSSSIVRSHGGELWLDDSGTHGAVFVFTLSESSQQKDWDDDLDHGRG